MKKVFISTDKAPKVVLSSVSQGVRVGDWIYMCGQLPLDLKTGEIKGSTIEEQAELCLQYVRAIVEAGGASMADVVKVTVMLTDITHFARFNAVYEKHFSAPGPARDCFEVGLIGAGKNLVELTAIACIGSGKQ